MNDFAAETGGTTSGLTNDLVALQDTYRELQSELLVEEDPKAQVNLLRRLADYRTAIANLDTSVTSPRPESAANGNSSHGDGSQRRPAVPPSLVAGVPTPVPAHPPMPPASIAPNGDASTLDPSQDLVPDDALTLRFLIEGPPQAGTTTVMDQLSDQFRADSSRSQAVMNGSTIDWFEFRAGIFEGRPIRFEVFNVAGGRSRLSRRLFRSLADTIVLVVDSTPAGLGLAISYAQEVGDDRASWEDGCGPELTVFAHKEDAEDALPVDAIASELHLSPETNIVATTRLRRGFLYGFALATGSAVRRVQEGEQTGRQRTEGRYFDGFVSHLRQQLTEPPEHADGDDGRFETGAQSMPLLNRPPSIPVLPSGDRSAVSAFADSAKDIADSHAPTGPISRVPAHPPRVQLGDDAPAAFTGTSTAAPGPSGLAASQTTDDPDSPQRGPTPRRRASALRRLIAALKTPQD